MKQEFKENIKKGLYFSLCIISLGLLCAFPFISKSCSSEQTIKNIDKSFSKSTGGGYMVEYPSNALTIFGQWEVSYLYSLMIKLKMIMNTIYLS